MSRHRYVVCYDVREPKRLRKMHHTLLGYGDPLQYSVFVCDLSAAERVLMEGPSDGWLRCQRTPWW
mgnify:CR=1 FL=1